MSVIKRVTATGEEHGLIKQMANSVPNHGYKHMEPTEKAKIEKERKEDARVVKARYINHRGMHERLTKPYCRYAGDTICTYHLIPGQEYDLPMGFIKEVNEAQGLASRGERIEERGNRNVIINKDEFEKIHELVPTSF